MKLGVWAAMGCAMLAGCATPVPPEPIASADRSAADFTARSLADPALHRYVADNLGRDPGDAWDFEALSWAAFRLNPSLALARAQWAGARAAATAAGEQPNPNLTLSPGYNFTRQAGLSPWMPAISLDFLFETGAKRELRQAAARHDAEAARLAVMSAAWQVRSELRQALTAASFAERRAAQRQTEATEQGALVHLEAQRFAAGGIAATELSVARSTLLRAEAAAGEAQGQVAAARSRVAAAIGVPATALDGLKLPVPPEPPAFSADALAAARREALHARADILTALARYHSAHAALQLEIARRLPDLHLGPGYQWDQGSNKWSLSLGLELPLFHRNEAGVAAAVARRAEAAAQFDFTQAQAIAAIDQATAEWEAAQAQVGRAERLRAEAGDQAERVRQRLAAGAADQVELRAAELELTTAAGVVLDAESAAATAGDRLEDALQVPFPHLARLTSPETATARPHE